METFMQSFDMKPFIWKIKNFMTKILDYILFLENLAVLHPNMFWYSLNGTGVEKYAQKLFPKIFPSICEN